MKNTAEAVKDAGEAVVDTAVAAGKAAVNAAEWTIGGPRVHVPRLRGRGAVGGGRGGEKRAGAGLCCWRRM